MIGLARIWEVKRRVRRRVKKVVKVRMMMVQRLTVFDTSRLVNIASKCLDIKNFKLTTAKALLFNKQNYFPSTSLPFNDDSKPSKRSNTKQACAAGRDV
jgi:hypothetical protein